MDAKARSGIKVRQKMGLQPPQSTLGDDGAGFDSMKPRNGTPSRECWPFHRMGSFAGGVEKARLESLSSINWQCFLPLARVRRHWYCGTTFAGASAVVVLPLNKHNGKLSRIAFRR